MSFDLAGKRIFVAGHTGMVGAAVCRRLERENCFMLIEGRPRLDLRDQDNVRRAFKEQSIDAVILAAATVGGIKANATRPAEFLYDNLLIAANVIEAAARSASVKKLLFLGSSCIYPKFAPQPISEDALLTGPLEPTNEWYAIAKIAGLKLCQAYRRQFGCDFISAMPTNLYGPGDNYDPESSHVVAALIDKFHRAKASGASEVEIWGTGTPRREFLHVDDLADALVLLMKEYSDERPINVGWGADITISELAECVAEVVGFEGALIFNHNMPDGTPRKLLDVSRLDALGWRPRIPLSAGLKDAYAWYLANVVRP